MRLAPLFGRRSSQRQSNPFSWIKRKSNSVSLVGGNGENKVYNNAYEERNNITFDDLNSHAEMDISKTLT